MLKKIFTNDKLFYMLPWTYLVCIVAYEIITYVNWNQEGIFFDVASEALNVLFIFGITISYKNHEKNITKMLFGAILAESVIYALNCAQYELTSPYGIVSKVCSLIYPVLYIVLFLNHLLLGYGHKASPKRVVWNRTIGLLIITSVIIWNIARGSAASQIVETVISIITETVIVLIVLCIETRVDAYKLDREAAGWTEETGYPKGYVHQKDRQKNK